MNAVSLSLSALCLSLCVPAARAGDFFVDVAHGSDAHDGTSAATAWKTLTHALAVGGAPNDFIHVAPGDYSAATGEVFPLHLGGPEVFGEEGAAVTRVIGTGTEVLFEGGASSQLSGLTLLNGATGLRVVLTQDFGLVHLTSLVIADMSGYGLELDAHPQSALVLPPAFLTCFTGLEVADCGGGVRMFTSGMETSQLILINSSVHDNAGDGIHLDSQAGSGIYTALNQTRVQGNGQAGVHADASGLMTLGFGICLIADNATGIEVVDGGGELQMGFYYCTVAGNAGTGLRVEKGMASTGELVGTLFWGNGEDVSGGGPLHATLSDSEQGVFGADDGNLSVDPQFAAAALGDYHLIFGSPCIDIGDPTLLSSSFDLDKFLAPADGNLDAVAQMDLGCFEFRPLRVETTGALGADVAFQFFGSPCMQTMLFVAPGGPSFGKHTAFGNLLLGPSGILPLLTTIALSPAPNVVAATIPGVPALVGATFTFQSLTQSIAAPRGAALTNVESFTVTE